MTKEELEDYLNNQLNKNDRKKMYDSLSIFQKINPIALTKWLESINESPTANIKIGIAVHKLLSSYMDSQRKNFESDLDALEPRYQSQKEMAAALNIDHRDVSKVVTALGIEKQGGYYGNSDAVKIKDICSNKEYGKGKVEVRIAKYLAIKDQKLEYVTAERAAILMNVKLNASENIGLLE